MPLMTMKTGAQLHYTDSGDGAETAVAIHGMLGTAQTHMGRLLDWLSSDLGYRALGPTLRGYGQSGPKPRDFPLDFYRRDADDVLALLDALKIERAHLLGYSDGGEVALMMAGLQPQRVASVAVWGAVGYFGPAMRPFTQRMYPATWIKPDEIALHGIDNPDAFALGWIKAVKHYIDTGGDVSLSLAPNITCPVLLMLGDEDQLNPEAYGRHYINQTRAGQLRMFACGHAVHDERWPEFQQVVAAFLQGAHR